MRKKDKARIEDYSQNKGLKHTPSRRGLLKRRVSEVVFVCCLFQEQEKNLLDVLTGASFVEKKTFVSNLIKTGWITFYLHNFPQRNSFLLLNDTFLKWEDEIGRAWHPTVFSPSYAPAEVVSITQRQRWPRFLWDNCCSRVSCVLVCVSCVAAR